ncbi:MAG: permease-like cell division protein FtsX [Oscillospiraceae bacterium]|jgi:cell division transport system permease protein|nr:permease-like cell division protein FtsX [Oscillospiraceae bacterium]MBQ2633472.1 permease-like cell division protein FtsX [Oscillospiraceae bacterium]MBR3082960.1 permease-like cell division protein FtsX [Oscillospiraceae bacterium]MBR7056530.1 permease-like cell division protein FtsX [Oscillospiraceae bacterium]
MKLTKIFYLIKEGVKSIFTHGFMSFACVLVIVACLLIMGNFALLSLNIDHNIEQLENQNEILAFVDESLSLDDAKAIGPRLRTLDNVLDVQFVTREEAMESFVSKYDDEEMFSDLTPSTFRNRYLVFLEDLSRMETTRNDIEQVEGIAEVSASLEVSRGFILVRNVVTIVSVALILILFVISIFIMQNTIKLATFSRREEIAIMKMVGAGNAFIRWPFIIQGLVLGMLGGVIAFLLQMGIYEVLTRRIAESSLAMMVEVLPFSSLMGPLLAVFLGLGLLVGTFGSSIAIRNYLKV